MPVSSLPDGAPITMRLNFGAYDLMDLDVSTKAEASPADEERIHDLYVMIFCNDESDQQNYHNKIYGRYFSYEHLFLDLDDLDSNPNEGWWVANKTLETAQSPVDKTYGAVKISTKVCSKATLVVIANVDNAICSLGDEEDPIGYLNSIHTLDQLRSTVVKLNQDIVNRKDLFLMKGVADNVNTGKMIWNNESGSSDFDETRLELEKLDAKVKFKIRSNPQLQYISAIKTMHWGVCNVPDRCYLFSDYDEGRAPEGTIYFDSEQAYFEGTEEDAEGKWYTFSFYTLESRHQPKASASSYNDREKQQKINTGKDGYTGPDSQEFGNNYVENGEWIYASPHAIYVKFDLFLTLTPEGVQALVGGSANYALTSDTIFTVHLGDFTNSGVDDYNTLRGTSYTYEITINNISSIYAEVTTDQERQPGQEGYLLLTDDEYVNADCHYEYHSITFHYDENLTPEKFSWYVKTPFTSQVGGGPKKDTYHINNVDYPIYDPHDTDNTLLDYRWVKFAINKEDANLGYSTNRMAYPGDGEYDPEWGAKKGGHGPWDTEHPELMDVSQLIQYIFEETRKETASEGSSDFEWDNTEKKRVIRATVFIDEYYYDSDPRDESGDPEPDPELWRQFINAQPRELHILSNSVQSRDRKSDVIQSSHSVIQQSIQSIYNVYEPSLRSIWGCEHLDEIKFTLKEEDGVVTENPGGDWPYWPAGCPDSEKAGANSDIGKENGRLNSAYIWGLYSRSDNSGSFTMNDGKGVREWETFLNYEVKNRVPEIVDNYKGMAWSCLSRNRDNNGNGTIEPEEVRWYLASSQQLAGIWVGNESLSSTARLYQPAQGQWRAHVVSSTAKLVSWAEEGGGATDIGYDVSPGDPYNTWPTAAEAHKGESVRCIRNIGTYDDPVKGLTDITYAPVTVLPDKYFTIERSDGQPVSPFNIGSGNGDENTYYTFHFDRLNTRSIREYSAGELPYHDQNSFNNRVYVQMITQPLSLDVDAYSVNLADINNLVTQAGYNEYCPEGYRFPNHTEWLLMSLYLPSNYLQKDKEGNTYAGGTAPQPSRTYYDRGYYGALRSDSAPWSTEKNKVGWVYSNKMHCSPYNQKVTHSRCVKDDDQTGVISGAIAVAGNTLYPGDVIPVDFKFSSTASTFTKASLKLQYTNPTSGFPEEVSLDIKSPTGLQYKEKQSIQIPSLNRLGISQADLPLNMTLRAEFENLSGKSGYDELNVSLENPLSGTLSVADDQFYPSDNECGSLSFSFSTAAHTVDLDQVSFELRYTNQESQSASIPLTGIGSPTGKHFSRDNVSLAIPSLQELKLDQHGFNLDWPMTLRATVTDESGMTCTVEKPVSLVSHLAGSSVQFPTAYDETDGIPVDVVVESVNNHATISSARFYWKKQGGVYQGSDITEGLGTSNMTTQTYVKNIIGQELSESNKGKYYFYLEATCSDGTSIRSDVWSMDILYYGKNWNPGPWSDANTVSDISVKWPVQSIGNLDFSRGDYVDAYIDVSNCVYIRKDGTANNDIGMDNVITLGASASLDWKNGDLYFYYPAHSPAEAPGEDRMQLSIKDNNNTVTRLRPYDLDGSLSIKLSKNLLLVNGAELDYSKVVSGNNSTNASNAETRSRATIEYITNQSTIKVGSVEGSHRSRATYKYVRVIRKETSEP